MSSALSRGTYKRSSGTRPAPENSVIGLVRSCWSTGFQTEGGVKASFIYEICVQMVKLVCGCFDRWLLRMTGGRADSLCSPSVQLTESLWNENQHMTTLCPDSAFTALVFVSLSLQVQIGSFKYLASQVWDINEAAYIHGVKWYPVCIVCRVNEGEQKYWRFVRTLWPWWPWWTVISHRLSPLKSTWSFCTSG